MAGWNEGLGIAKELYSYKSLLAVAILTFVTTCVSVPSAYAQNGFLSLDCGSQANFIDSRGLNWVSDDIYIYTGKSSQQPYVGDNKALGSFRYFPEDRSKFCYGLPAPFYSYLVRASFYMDQSELKTRQPFKFTLSIDATNWVTISSGDVTAPSPYLVVQEGIFHPPYLQMNFCLQPVYGMPFISSLEVRVLDMGGAMFYSYDGSLSQYLSLAFRYNTGAMNTPDVRYPDDPYDRIWTTPDASWDDKWQISINSTQLTYNSTDYTYHVPTKVMQDAWLFPSNGSALFPIDPVYPDGPHAFLSPTEYAFVVVHSYDLNKSPSDVASNSASLNMDQDAKPLSVSSQNPTVWNYFELSRNGINISLSSNVYSPSMNAIEVYGQISYNHSTTNTDDDVVIGALQKGFSLTDWQGDPCVPVPYNWLSCNLDGGTFNNLINESGASQQRTIYSTKFYVTTLILSNITNTNFSGMIGDSVGLQLSRLHGLNAMTITSSGVDYPTFLFLINYTSSELTTLNLSHNAIGAFPRASDWAGVDNAGFKNLTTLDLSHNTLTGLLSSFEDVPFSRELQHLDLSYNQMTSFPNQWGNTTIKSLVTLDLSHNQFHGEISSLDQWVQINSGSLQELDLSYNILSGTFSSDFYFSRLPSLTFANFDQNSIEGTLDLSTWYAALQDAARQSSNNSNRPLTVTQQLFSFMNNNIMDIIPPARSFDSTVHSLFKENPAIGVMLYGNPYCNYIKSSVQGYLCRSSIATPFQDYTKKNEKAIFIISISSGIGALLFLSIISATLWRLWKQVHILRGIQQALVDRKVQPPFYQYNDLKTSTRNFHKNNKLGHGGFGVVYKGVLVDETLAVKKLFNSQTAQVLDEFLNEVVLITGIKHRNLVQLKGCCIKEKQRILVYDYVEKGNLADALWGSNVHWGLNWKQRFNICVGVARGLSYLHEELQPSIVHRDIKPQNILLDKNLNPKIADFGLARHLSHETSQAHYTQLAGTIGYFAPEYAMQGQLSEKTDVYSYGVLILEIISGRRCIDSSRPIEEKFLIDWVGSMRKTSLLFDVLQPELRENCDKAEVIRAIKIGLLCVQHRPERRPTMSQVITMFLGTMHVAVLADESDDIHSNLEDLMATVSRDGEYPSMVVIKEESDTSPMLYLDSQSTSRSTFGVSSSSSRVIIELSDFSGL